LSGTDAALISKANVCNIVLFAFWKNVPDQDRESLHRNGYKPEAGEDCTATLLISSLSEIIFLFF